MVVFLQLWHMYLQIIFRCLGLKVNFGLLLFGFGIFKLFAAEPVYQMIPRTVQTLSNIFNISNKSEVLI